MDFISLKCIISENREIQIIHYYYTILVCFCLYFLGTRKVHLIILILPKCDSIFASQRNMNQFEISGWCYLLRFALFQLPKCEGEILLYRLLFGTL